MGLRLIEKRATRALKSLTPTAPTVLSHPVSYWLQSGMRHLRLRALKEPDLPAAQRAIARREQPSRPLSLAGNTKGKGEGDASALGTKSRLMKFLPGLITALPGSLRA